MRRSQRTNLGAAIQATITSSGIHTGTPTKTSTTITASSPTSSTARYRNSRTPRRAAICGDEHVAADGGPQNPESVSATFRKLVDSVEVPRIRLHDLRYTHATIMLQHGANPKVVSERLGHSSIAITLGVYQAVMPGMQAAAAEQFMGAVFGQPAAQ